MLIAAIIVCLPGIRGHWRLGSPAHLLWKPCVGVLICVACHHADDVLAAPAAVVAHQLRQGELLPFRVSMDGWTC